MSAQDATIDSSAGVNTRAAQVEIRAKAQTDLKMGRDARKAELETQREKLKAEAQTRREAAQKMGDEAKARREAMKVEREEKRAEMDAKREAKRVEIEAKREEMKTKRVEFQQSVAKRKVENTARVISATIDRLEKIIVRVESRIAKVKSNGGDTAESERYVALAKDDLAKAEAVVATFASLDLTSEKAKENFERIRTAAGEAREYIRSAHENLMLAVRNLSSKEINVESN